MVAQKVDPTRLVFVDEMGTNTSLSPLYAYSPKGRRAYAEVPRNRGKNTTLLASMSLEGMGPSLAVEGATSATVFESYVEQLLAPTLRRGQIIVVDNLSAHKGERVRELIEARGCELLYLPPYSPDFNPIEEKPSRRSRDCCARRRHEAAKPLLKRWAERSRRSAQWMPEVSSNIAVTVYPSIFCETRCKLRNLRKITLIG
jgi:transposase